MKKMIALTAAVVMLFTAMFAGAALAAEAEDITGEWHALSMKQGDVEMDAALLSVMGMDLLLEFGEDGAASLSMMGEPIEGVWELNGTEGVIKVANEGEEERSLPFTVEDGVITIDINGSSAKFSREGASLDSAKLAPAVADAKLEDFNGDWKLAYYVAFGLPLPLAAVGLDVAMTVEDGNIAVTKKTIDLNSSSVTDTQELAFTGELQDDGTLFVDLGEENFLAEANIEATSITLTLHEDGRLSGTAPELTKMMEDMKALSEAAANAETPAAEGEEGAAEGESSGAAGESADSSSGESSENSWDAYLIFERQ